MEQINRIITSQKLMFLGYIILSSIIILLPAFYNGYPLFYSDSALYIDVAMRLGNLHPGEIIPCLSGFGYAFFINIVTWKTTLYLVVLAQAVILNVLIYLSLKVLLPEHIIIRSHLATILILSIFSSMGWTASQLMPDIFTSFLILSVFLFFAWNKTTWSGYIFLSLIIIFSILSHLSNLSISVLILAMLFLLFILIRSYRMNLKILTRKTLLILALVFSSVFILKGLNKVYYNYNGLSPTSHIFFFARLIDTGFMQEFLNEKCGNNSYEICQYKDSLPDSYESFLWSPESVFYKTGGWDLTAHEEYKRIIFDVLTTPKYLAAFLYNSSIHSFRQLITFKTGDGLKNIYTKESGEYQTVIRTFNHAEFRDNFQASKQIQGTLNFGMVNLMNYILVFIAVLIIIWTLIFRTLDKNLLLFTYIIICSVVINAAATASLASVFDRFQSRVIWLIPLLALIYIFKFISPALKIYLNKLLKKSTNS